MNALLKHRWGVSPAQDRIWAQVAGMRPDHAVRQFFMVLEYQGFIDGSARAPDGDFVLGGYIATAETWASFSKDWEKLLPLATKSDKGVYRFKMSEMAMSAERMARVPQFYKMIEGHDLLPISCRFSLEDFATAQERVNSILLQLGHEVNFGFWKNPYFLAFRGLLDTFHYERAKFVPSLPLEQSVRFYFDDQTEKTVIHKMWDDWIAGIPEELGAIYSKFEPRFESDEEFMGLQAADFWSWWVRNWYEEDAFDPPAKMDSLDFNGLWRGKRRPYVTISFDEDRIVDAMQQLAISGIAQDQSSSSGA